MVWSAKYYVFTDYKTTSYEMNVAKVEPSSLFLVFVLAVGTYCYMPC